VYTVWYIDKYKIKNIKLHLK